MMQRPIGLLLTEPVIDSLDKELRDSFTLCPEFPEQFKYSRSCLEEFGNQPTIRYLVNGTSQVPGMSTDPQDLFEEQQIAT